MKALWLLCLLSVYSSARAQNAAPLTAEERMVLERGEVTDGAYYSGAFLGTFVGFGVGNAIQGTYLPRGLIFTVGESAATGMMISGLLDCFGNLLTAPNQKCQSSGALTTGIAIFLGLRIWEVIDVWTTIPAQNREVRELRKRAGLEPQVGLAPVSGPDGALTGGQLSFTFRF